MIKIDNEVFWIGFATIIVVFLLVWHSTLQNERKKLSALFSKEYPSTLVKETIQLDRLHHPENDLTFPLSLTGEDFDRHQYPDKLEKYPIQLRDPYQPAWKKTPGPIMGNVIPVDIYQTGYDDTDKVGFLYSGAPHYYRMNLFARRLYPKRNFFQYYLQAPNGIDRIVLPHSFISDGDYILGVPGYNDIKFQASIYNQDVDGIRYNPYF